ncbi:hypothetical protein BC829DRAFT_33392 [Chytridium lagenaria]|nr:hypothetical protein BC829DRAFT_33392 [Chytridium lagenaria]
MVQINNGELIKACCYLNALNVFLLVLWTFFTPPVPAIVLLKDSHFWTCQSRNGQTGWTIIGLLFAYNALLLGAAVFLTSRTRKVQGPFNEARFVGYAVYTMVLVDIILVPLSFIDTFGATFQYIFRCLAIELSCLAVAYHLFVPKIVALIWNSEIDELAVSTAYVRHGSYPTSEIDSMVGVRQSSGAPAAPSKLPPGIKGHVQENNHTVSLFYF